VRIDTATGKLTYANAGHNPPLLVRGSGQVDSLATTGTVLGVFAESAYEQGDFVVVPGDRLVLYTDGITEGRNPAGDEFGEDRLSESAARHRALPAEEMLAGIMADVEGFNAGAYEDDATLIVAALQEISTC
jgi:serine phosphatase RsbU (regulator of sigma subunit)